VAHATDDQRRRSGQRTVFTTIELAPRSECLQTLERARYKATTRRKGSGNTELTTSTSIAKNPLVSWVLANPVQTATLLGGVAYVLVIASYRSALRPFGATPTDVGIGYVDAVWPVLGIVCYICIVALMAMLIVARSPETLYRVLRSTVLRILALFALILIPTAVAIVEETQYTRSVRAGKPCDPSLDRLRVLSALRANLVTISWKDSKETKPALPTKPVLFLGSANGIAVIYDHSEHSTVRLPLSDIVLANVLSVPAKLTNDDG